MAVIASGTLTPATLGVEENINTNTTVGVQTLFIDTTTLTGAEQLDLTVKMNALSGGTQVVVDSATYVGAQAQPGKVSIPRINQFNITFTIKQTGTPTAFPWRVETP